MRHKYMSKYMDNKQSFLEPEVNQYSSHMVMTNVVRPLRRKFLNMDTRYRDNYTNYNTSTACQNTSNSLNSTTVALSIPEVIRNVRSMKVQSTEIPFSYFNISASLGNNSILFTDNLGTKTVYTVPDGYYTNNTGAPNGTTISSYFTSNPVNSYIAYVQYNKYFSQFVFTAGGGVNSMTVNFAVDSSGNPTRVDLKSRLGWMLGFRNSTYTFTTNIKSEAMINLMGFRYLFLLVDDYKKSGDDNNFISPLYSSFINKNVLARIVLDTPVLRPFGDSYIVSTENFGTLVSDTRRYSGEGVDLQRFQISLVNEYGMSINLNGLDYSFVMELEYE